MGRVGYPLAPVPESAADGWLLLAAGVVVALLDAAVINPVPTARDHEARNSCRQRERHREVMHRELMPKF